MSNTNPRDPVTWLAKLDENEKSLDALLLGLAGALLAFVANYVKDGGSIDKPDRYIAASAIVLASASLTIGLIRSWLRSNVYEGALIALQYDAAEKLAKEVGRGEEAKAAEVRARILATPGMSDQQRAEAIGRATAEVFDERFDATISLARELLAKAKNIRRVGWMKRLFGPQIVTFVLGALAVAVIVLRRLAA